MRPWGLPIRLMGPFIGLLPTFRTAFSPQIVKYYAAGKSNEMNLLVFRASKISFFLMLLLALPVMVNVDFILGLWLKVVPYYAPSFVCLMLGYCLVDTLSIPIYTLVNASGKISDYQLIIGTIFILNVPLAYWLLSLGLSPVWVLFTRVCISFLLTPVRLLIAKKVAAFPGSFLFRTGIFKSFVCIFRFLRHLLF